MVRVETWFVVYVKVLPLKFSFISTQRRVTMIMIFIRRKSRNMKIHHIQNVYLIHFWETSDVVIEYLFGNAIKYDFVMIMFSLTINNI